jgi:hypothetical protein
MSEAVTNYRVVDDRGGVETVQDAERAERLSRAGLTVTAVSYTEAQR